MFYIVVYLDASAWQNVRYFSNYFNFFSVRDIGNKKVYSSSMSQTPKAQAHPEPKLIPLPPLFAESKFHAEWKVLYPLIQEAGTFLLEQRKTQFTVGRKPDNSIVTEVDHACAAFLDRAIEKAFPQDGILNEETYQHLSVENPWFAMDRCWIIDPLDSTSSYVSGGEDYGVIIGLTLKGKPVLGITYKPEKQEIFFAAQDEGCFRISLISELATYQASEATQYAQKISVTNIHTVQLVLSKGRQSEELMLLIKTLEHPQVTHQNGSLKINEVACGNFTAFISPLSHSMSLWDLCAPQIILQEAGGRITDYHGHPLQFRTEDPTHLKGIIATNETVHKYLLEKLHRIPHAPN